MMTSQALAAIQVVALEVPKPLLTIVRLSPVRDGAGAPGGPSKAEPGAGSAGPGAGPGAAQRRRLI